jgi:biotin carboxyl carrier protein
MARVSPGDSSRPSRRLYILVLLFLLAMVALPFWFWYDTWFGRHLSDSQIDQYLSDTQKPRHAQQALIQIGERMSRGDESARRWYPKVIELSSKPAPELRQTAAWIMGQDRHYEPFRPALRHLLADPEPLVRRNAALALAALRDPIARPELRAMLRPSTINSPAAGKLAYRLKPGDYVNPGTLVARVGEVEVRASLPGEVQNLLEKDGTEVREGEPLAEIAPDEQHAWEALRALFLVGNREDLEEVQHYARGVEGMSSKVQQQAVLTMQQIQARP